MKKTAQCNMFQLLAKNVHLLSIPSKLIRGGSGFALIQLFKKSMYRLFHTFLMTLTIFVIECVRIIYGLNNQLEYDLFIFCWKWNVISNIVFPGKNIQIFSNLQNLLRQNWQLTTIWSFWRKLAPKWNFHKYSRRLHGSND